MLLAALGLILIAILMSRKVGGAILIGIVVTAVAGIPLKLTSLPSHLFSLPHPAGTFMKMDFRSAARLGLGELIFVFFFVDLFDNVGTLVGVCEQGGFMRDGKFPRASRALLADAFGTMIGAITGTSTVTSYIESAAGVAAGARTGLGNLVIAGLFLGAMFCAPVVAAIPSYATAPALILVGALIVHVAAENQVGRFYRRVSGVHDHGGDAADVQHCDGAEPGAAVVYVFEGGHGTGAGDQPTDLDTDRFVCAAVCVSWGGVRPVASD